MGVGSVGPAVTAEVVPQVLDAIEFRGVRRQRDQGDVGGHLQIVSAMESGSVPDQGGVNIGSQRAGELVEKLVDDRRVEHGRENGLGLTGLRAGGPDEPDVFVFGLPHGGRPRATLGPPARQCPLLTEAALILEEGDDLLVGMLGLDASQFFGDFFLKTATASGSDLRCFGRGTSHS